MNYLKEPSESEFVQDDRSSIHKARFLLKYENKMNHMA